MPAEKRTSPIVLVVAVVAAAGLGVLSPACGADSASSGPGITNGSLPPNGNSTTGNTPSIGGGSSVVSGAGGTTSVVPGAGGSSAPAVTTAVCTSGVTWTRGNDVTMRPGEACISCHGTNPEAPVFVIAGTVYPTAHEPADCNGSNASGAATVIITDAQGVAHSIPVNAAGNFMLEGAPIPLPYTARVQVGSATRAMAASQTSGDCNSCHTQTGANGAPGRIMLP